MAGVPARGMRRLIGGVALSALVGVTAAVFTAAPGWAADSLTFADPADGVALAAAPHEVVLAFSAIPDPSLSHVSTLDSSGTDVGTGEPRGYGRAGLRLSVAIRSIGEFTIAYHVVFGDGTDLTGVLRFSVGTGVAPSPLTAGQVQRARQAVAAGHVHTVDPVSGTLLVADVVVLIGVLLMLRRRPGPPYGPSLASDPDHGAGS